MKIDHIAIWVRDLESTRDFYVNYFSATSGELYHNPNTGFHSYFLSFENGPRIELMHRSDIREAEEKGQKMGMAHFALALGSRQDVDRLTEKIREDGHKIIGEPRTTGDGYYESVISDPEGNLIELTV